MIDFLKRIKRRICAFCERRKAWRQAVAGFRHDAMRFRRHAGALHLDRKAAARAEIVMGYHVLEKGLTMPRRRLGFGQAAVLNLMRLISEYERRFGSRDSQVEHAIGVLREYRGLHRDWPQPMARLDEFLERHSPIPASKQRHFRREEFFAARDAAFPAFASSRHVCRHFAGEVPRKTREEAVALAQTAPSACNRQHVRVHVISDKAMRDALFAVQGGTRGFGQDADKVIVVTSDLSAVRWGWERHDAYTNGGIFVMNLCYALHYHGIAHCILHWSVSPEADKKAHELVSIPENEAIVQVVACGMPPEEFDVASSPRLALDEVMTWH